MTPSFGLINPLLVDLYRIKKHIYFSHSLVSLNTTVTESIGKCKRKISQ